MITISLCMIVKNEEDVLARCLDSVGPVADEIIIVDTGSDDATKEIAGRYTDKVYDFAWIDDFAAARNYAFDQATMEYCLWLDADDVLAAAEQKKFLQLKAELDPAVDFVMMKYNTAFDAAGNPSFSYYRERLLKRSKGYRWQGAVHEVIAPAGQIIHSEIAIDHKKLHPSDPDRNLQIFEKLLAQGRELEPRQQFYYARELYYHAQYAKAIQVLEGFLDQSQGWLENNIEACRVLAACHRGLGQQRLALRALLRSLEWDVPRAEVCCEIGAYFLERGTYQQAILWYQTATGCQRDDASGAFVEDNCYGYLPYIQLCVCYDKLGHYQLAEQCNELAGHYKPDDAAYLYNKKYFDKLRQTQQQAEEGKIEAVQE